MAEVLLTEIGDPFSLLSLMFLIFSVTRCPFIRSGRRPHSDSRAVDREGFSLAAGLALGLVALGRGRDAIGLSDLRIEGRLSQYAAADLFA